MEIPVWIQDGFFLTGRRSIDGSELFVHWNKASGTPVFFDGSAETCSWFLFFHCCSLPSALPAQTTNVLISCLFSCNDLSYPGPRIFSSPFCFHIPSEFKMCFIFHCFFDWKMQPLMSWLFTLLAFYPSAYSKEILLKGSPVLRRNT